MVTESKFHFIQESEIQRAVPVSEYLKNSIEQLPPLDALPATLDIGEPLPFMDEAIHESGDVREQSLKAVLEDLRTLEDTFRREYAVALVNRGGELTLGPYIQGDEQSVYVSAPLRRTERQTASGLYVCEMDSIVAEMHTHRVDATFSIADLFGAMGFGNEAIRQSYIVRQNGGIDLVIRTEESRQFGKETLERLVDLWDQFEMQFNATAVTYNDTEWLQERNNYILRVIVEELRLGFYTNHGNERSSQLQRVVSK